MSSNKKLANDLIPGSTMHPGELLRDGLDARRLKHIAVAKVMGVAKNVMSEIINGKRSITPDLAVRLEAALGYEIKAEFGMKYQVKYEIDKIRIKSRRSAQKEAAPTPSKRLLESI
jgi:HTH-type transcriptional regulator/antitoxin HigA